VPGSGSGKGRDGDGPGVRGPSPAHRQEGERAAAPGDLRRRECDMPRSAEQHDSGSCSVKVSRYDLNARSASATDRKGNRPFGKFSGTAEGRRHSAFFSNLRDASMTKIVPTLGRIVYFTLAPGRPIRSTSGATMLRAASISTLGKATARKSTWATGLPQAPST
jgi:hypothetical protein